MADGEGMDDEWDIARERIGVPNPAAAGAGREEYPSAEIRSARISLIRNQATVDEDRATEPNAISSNALAWPPARRPARSAGAQPTHHRVKDGQQVAAGPSRGLF
jgi:hypothetical protein